MSNFGRRNLRKTNAGMKSIIDDWRSRDGESLCYGNAKSVLLKKPLPYSGVTFPLLKQGTQSII